jgi:RNA polymerase sigma-70 factor (ECF subfamily)
LETNSTGAVSPRHAVFVTTHWSLVLAAARNDTTRAHEALAHLCATYWYPLYAYVRRRGQSPEDAQDLTQGFFACVLEHNWLARADREKGRFRSFLLMAMKRFMAKEWEKLQAQKRGGRIRHVPFQFDTAETRYSQEPGDTSTPDQVFEKQWALTLLQSVLQRLRADYAQNGKGGLFETLEPCLIGSRETQPYATLATQLDMTEGAVKVAVSRLRERYRKCLKDEIARTVATPADVDEELGHLFRVLAVR